MHLDPQAVACPFEPFPHPWMYSTTIEMFCCLIHFCCFVRLGDSGCLPIVDVVFVVEFVFFFSVVSP